MRAFLKIINIVMWVNFFTAMTLIVLAAIYHDKSLIYSSVFFTLFGAIVCPALEDSVKNQL